MDEKRKRRVRSYFGFVISLILGHATQRQRSSACRRQQKSSQKKPSGNASQLAGNDAQPRETSTTGADEVMDRIRALGYVPKETKTNSNPNDRILARKIRRLKKADRLAVRK